MPDLIRHPVFSMDVACASEDTGACALQGTRALEGIRRNDGNSALLLPKYIVKTKRPSVLHSLEICPWLHKAF
jgi:hypothetical protein